MDLDRTERDRQYERARDAERERAGDRDPSYRSSRRRGSHAPEDEDHEQERDRRRRLSRSSELPYGEDVRSSDRKRAATAADGPQGVASTAGAETDDGQRERKMPRLDANGDVTMVGLTSSSSLFFSPLTTVLTFVATIPRVLHVRRWFEEGTRKRASFSVAALRPPQPIEAWFCSVMKPY